MTLNWDQTPWGCGKPKPKSRWVDCLTCEGGGEVITMTSNGAGLPIEVKLDCPDCDGLGGHWHANTT